MIRLFNRNETNFNHNEIILTPLSCYVIEEANGMYELEAEFVRTAVINEGDIVKAPSPRGEQLFRIYRIKKSLKGKTAYARHIFYDLSKNFLIDVNLDNVSGFTAIQSVLSNTETSHNFVTTSDVLAQNSARYTRINPVQAIIGEDNSILNTWGGNLIRDNFNIDIKAEGTDRGYEIRLGKNLIGINADIDESRVKTSIYPTVILGDDDTVYSLPEKYVDSPYINNYGEPIIYTEEIKLTDDQKILPIENINEIMRDYCNDLFSIYNIDKPVINYKVNFVELSKTEQYKDLAILEQLDLYDIVIVKVSHLDINVKARVIKYKYDCLKERYESIELGDFSAVSSYKTENIVKQLRSSIKDSQSAAEYATNVISGNKGGYIVQRRYPDGKPYEFLVMDTEDINTAQNLFRLNNSGLGFSRNGYNGTYGTAMTIDGHIVADYIDTGVLKSILVQSDNYVPNESGTKINLVDGTIDTKYFKSDSSGAVFNGSLGADAINANVINALNITANSVNSNWVYTGNLIANQIKTGTMDANTVTIENLVVGTNVSMGSNATISWSQITNQPYIPTLPSYITSTKITSTAIEAPIITGGVINGGEFNSYDAQFGTLNIEGAYIMGWDKDGNNDLNLSSDGNLHCKTVMCDVMKCSTGKMNENLIINTGNKDDYLYQPMSHSHSGYAELYHTQSSYTITPSLTAAGNISLLGSPNAASTTWCEATFEPKSSSDFRLKKNIHSLVLPDELFMSLKPKSFEYKCDEYKNGQVFGLLAQQVESAFKQYGYDPYDYNLIELVDPKTAYTDEGLYIGKDKVHRINYINLIPWNISVTQKLYQEVSTLKDTVQKQQIIIDSQTDKINDFEERLSKLDVA